MKRQFIIDSIAEQLRLISATNGFYSEAGKNVFEWLEKPLDKDEYPAIIVRDVTDDVSDGQILEHSLKIEVDVAVSNKSTSLWDMREVTSDVLKAFGNLENTINYKCRYLGSDFLVEQKDTIYGGVRITFSVSYETPRWEQ